MGSLASVPFVLQEEKHSEQWSPHSGLLSVVFHSLFSFVVSADGFHIFVKAVLHPIR